MRWTAGKYSSRASTTAMNTRDTPLSGLGSCKISGRFPSLKPLHQGGFENPVAPACPDSRKSSGGNQPVDLFAPHSRISWTSPVRKTSGQSANTSRPGVWFCSHPLSPFQAKKPKALPSAFSVFRCCFRWFLPQQGTQHTSRFYQCPGRQVRIDIRGSTEIAVPIQSCTCFMLTPACTRRLAQVCRRS